VRARKAYIGDFIDAIAARVGTTLFSSIFAYSLWNELYFETATLPFSSASISVTTGNGQTYSMADPSERQRAADENSVYAINLLADAIHARDPGSLVTVGAWSNLASGVTAGMGLPLTGWAYPPRILTLANVSHLDLLDQHMGYIGTFEAELASIEWSSMPPSMPVIMGETAAFKKDFATAALAAEEVKTQNIAGWQHGFAGLLFWTYDCTEQPELWPMVDDDGAIAQALARANRPAPGLP
jgi:hypothetical protein